MIGIIGKIAGIAVNSFFNYKLKKAETENEKLKIETDREKNLDAIKGAVLSKGAFWFQLFFIIPVAMHFSFVTLYSMFWCSKCIYPYAGKESYWEVAAIPSPLDQAYPVILAFLFLDHVVRKNW